MVTIRFSNYGILYNTEFSYLAIAYNRRINSRRKVTNQKKIKENSPNGGNNFEEILYLISITLFSLLAMVAMSLRINDPFVWAFFGSLVGYAIASLKHRKKR
jgi:hypothetical protein